jgi:hypothetical protein
MKALLENHGSVVTSIESEDDNHSLNLSSFKVSDYTAPYAIVRKMRASDFKPHVLGEYALLDAAGRFQAISATETGKTTPAVEYWTAAQHSSASVTCRCDKQRHHVLQERPIERFGFGGLAIVQLHAKRRFALLAQP